MIINSILFMVLLISVKNSKRYLVSGYSYLVVSVLFVILFSLLLFLIHISTSYFSSFEDLFISDEIGYLNSTTMNPFNSARGSWEGLNYFLINYDIYGLLAIKLINIPILAILLVYIARVFKDGKLLLYIVLLCPFLLTMTYFNLRDLAILLAAIVTLFGLQNRRYLTVVFGLMLIITLRPLMAFILIACTAACMVSAQSISTRMKFFRIGPMLVLIFALVWIVAGKYVEQYLTYMTYLQSVDSDHRTILADSSTSLPIAYLRYVFTPVPTSLLHRLLNDGVTEWGIMHDIIRIFNQIFLYFILGCFGYLVFFKRRKMIVAIRLLSTYQKAFILLLLSFSIIYAVHLGGVGHSRLKVPFQMGLTILIYLSFFKKNGGVSESMLRE